MRLIGFMTFRDEEDILGETVPDFCRKLDALVAVDCGSEDRSQEIVADLESRHPNLIVLPPIGPHYAEQVRRHFWYAIRHQLRADDWIFIADADEFIHSDVRRASAMAHAQGADVIFGVHANFYYTDTDHKAWLEGRETLEDRTRKIATRRTFYRMQTSQSRGFRGIKRLRWNSDTSFPDGLEVPSSETVVFRHYQYRDPPQIQRRQEIRSKFDKSQSVMTDNSHWHATTFEEKISRGDPKIKRWDGVSALEPDPHLPCFNIYPPFWKRLAKKARRIFRTIGTRQEPCLLFEQADLARRLEKVLEKT